MKLRALLASLLLAGALAGPVSAAPPVASGTIEYASVDPVIGGEVTFTVTTTNLKGNQYPLVYLRCVNGANETVYGQLDLPSTVFILGGGSSDWITVGHPNYHVPATCTAYLKVYGPQDQGQVILDQTEAFVV